jgi:hypothetical protein
MFARFFVGAVKEQAFVRVRLELVRAASPADRREGRAQGLRLYRARRLPSLQDVDRLQPLS